jgi:hypothetical protein
VQHLPASCQVECIQGTFTNNLVMTLPLTVLAMPYRRQWRPQQLSDWAPVCVSQPSRLGFITVACADWMAGCQRALAASSTHVGTDILVPCAPPSLLQTGVPAIVQLQGAPSMPAQYLQPEHQLWRQVVGVPVADCAAAATAPAAAAAAEGQPKESAKLAAAEALGGHNVCPAVSAAGLERSCSSGSPAA